MILKKITVLFCIIFLAELSNAQFFAGISGNAVVPTSKTSNQFDFGYGSSVSLGYAFNKKMDLSVGYEYMKFSSLVPEFIQSAEYLKVKYKFFQSAVQPYLGVRTGVYHSSQAPANTKLKENNFGFAPGIGVLFDFGTSSIFRIDTELSYTNLVKRYEFRYFGFRIGIYYLFKQ